MRGYFTKKLDILLNISYFLPNAFTPNNDGVNDIYVGTGALAGMQNFSMNIYNRWGEMIYYSEDPGAGWNGKRHNNGPLAVSYTHLTLPTIYSV